MHNPVLKGKFIVIDGIDFCGKGTQIDRLVTYLKNHPKDENFKFISVVSTREPSNSHHSLEIRKTLQSSLDPYEKAQKLTELFVNDRKAHLTNLIEPNIKAGAFVISDRYMYSTLAYQQTQGILLKNLLEMHSNMRIPDLVFLINISGKESLIRKAVKKDKRPDEMFDKIDFQEKLSQSYLALKELLPNHPIHIIDGTQSIETIAKEIQSKVNDLIEKDYPTNL